MLDETKCNDEINYQCLSSLTRLDMATFYLNTHMTVGIYWHFRHDIRR